MMAFITTQASDTCAISIVNVSCITILKEKVEETIVSFGTLAIW